MRLFDVSYLTALLTAKLIAYRRLVEWWIMQHWWNDNHSGKPKYSEENICFGDTIVSAGTTPGASPWEVDEQRPEKWQVW